jgi:hypothetical protein
LFEELCKEYTYRYGKIHLCEKKFKGILMQRPKNIPIGPMTPFALAMNEDCKTDDPVESYRNYYIRYKQHICVWSKRSAPEWFQKFLDTQEIKMV